MCGRPFVSSRVAIAHPFFRMKSSLSGSPSFARTSSLSRSSLSFSSEARRSACSCESGASFSSFEARQESTSTQISSFCELIVLLPGHSGLYTGLRLHEAGTSLRSFERRARVGVPEKNLFSVCRTCRLSGLRTACVVQDVHVAPRNRLRGKRGRQMSGTLRGRSCCECGPRPWL